MNSNPANSTNSTIQDLAFKNYYDEKILPHVEEYEAKRQVMLKQCSDRNQPCFMFSVILLLIIGYCYVDPNRAHSILWFCSIVLLICVYTFYKWPVWKYQRETKVNIYPIIFAYFDTNLIYTAHQTIDANDLFKSGMICEGELYCPGIINVKMTRNDVPIEINQIMLRVKGGLNYYPTALIRCTMNKTFGGKTAVLLGINFPAKMLGFDIVTLEDTEFNNQFCVFSSNQVEARYLLTPAFMERLLSLEKLCGGGVSCCFYDEKIVIQLRHTDTNKWFDSPSIDRKVDFIPECNMIITQMNEIFRIIDILKLNQKSVI